MEARDDYSLDERGHFVIEDFQNKPAFASFLSGIAGRMGIPIWAFYVNRGQCIASFGIESKEHPIMEYHPADKSYRNVETTGFRTFVKVKEGNQETIHEPFRSGNEETSTRMIIAPHSLTIEEKNFNLNLKTKVRYYILPNENFGALIRQVNVENTADFSQEIEILDGMPIIIPYGIGNRQLKAVSHTTSAWVKVYGVDDNTPFYRVRTTTEDEARVERMSAGNFYIPFVGGKTRTELLSPLVDPKVIFERQTSLEEPIGFAEGELAGFDGKQIQENRYPAAMTATKEVLEGGENVEINSVFGNLESREMIDEVKDKVLRSGYLDEKKEEVESLHDYYVDHAFTVSGEPRLDAYTKQTFMDNMIRGGFPIIFGGGESGKVHHVFLRKHGDLERDYNEFFLEPNYYSQGNGNYRDINQNRRCYLFFNPRIGEYNVKVFNDLIQPDGYNPLVVQGNNFYLEGSKAKEVVEHVAGGDRDELLEKLSEPFTPGKIALFIDNSDLELDLKIPEFMDLILENAGFWVEAEFGDGYWTDHWTYNLDLIKNYLAVFPERLGELLLGNENYTFHDSAIKVRSRDEKYVLTERGPRQLGAIKEDSDKRDLLEERDECPHCVRTENGRGEIYRTTLLCKLLTLVINKLSSLDPGGVGIELEANKPGWCDALNGLPGIFGSSTPEMMELLRLVNFLRKSLEQLGALESSSIGLPVELYRFYEEVGGLLDEWLEEENDFNYWGKATSARESYREEVFMGFDGEERELALSDLKRFLDKAETKLSHAFKSARGDDGLFTTYFSYKPTDFERTGEVSEEGLPRIRVTKFEQHRLPEFLEGQVRSMKIMPEGEARKLHENVRDSELYDEKLDMYRVNGEISSESYDIGRIRAFSPGWLENGSIWVHMEYKYLLELLKSGLYEEFYRAFENALIPFQDPETYGRSILENSSFILSSLSDDSENHGRGYIARLSGSTAEYLHIWSLMCFGPAPFRVDDGELVYSPQPALKGDLFTEEKREVDLQTGETESTEVEVPENSFAHRFLGATLVVYHNPKRGDTFGSDKVSIEGYKLMTREGEEIEVEGREVASPLAERIRSGEIARIDIYLN